MRQHVSVVSGPFLPEPKDHLARALLNGQLLDEPAVLLDQVLLDAKRRGRLRRKADARC